jgi:hypothetical protein
VKATLRVTSLFLIAGLCSCAVNSRSYVERLAGFSVTEGRITRIDNLETDELEPLEDGLAVTLSKPCQVWMEFDNGETRSFDLSTGVIIVHGYDSDFILESAMDPVISPAPAPNRDR